MTRTRAAIIAATGLTLTASLGAAPSTQPVAAAAAAAANAVEVRRMFVPGSARGSLVPALPHAAVPHVGEAGRIVVPPRIDRMPRAPVYLTPRAQWIPKRFNGRTFYVIPCEAGDAGDKGASPAPRATGTIAVPATQPSLR